jgi:hypothetical protein
MSEDFQFYSVIYPELNETVLVKFTKRDDTHIEGELIEYNLRAIMSYNDATKKKKVYSWNKIVPLNELMIAKVEELYEEYIQVSIAYNKENIDTLKPFNDNKKLVSMFKKICNVMKIDFNTFWKNIIHIIDQHRRNESNESLYEYFINSIELYEKLINDNYENGNEINKLIKSYLKNIIYKIRSKVGIISMNNINDTIKFFDDLIKNNNWDFTIKYETAPYYIIESNSSNSSYDNHEELVKNINELGQKYKLFTKIEYIGKKHE